MARDFAARRAARRLPRRQHLRARTGRRDHGLGRRARWSSSRTSRTPRTSASSPTATTARSPTSSRRRAVVDLRYDAPPSTRRRRRSLLLPARRLRDHRRAGAVEPRRARDHGRQPRLRAARRPGSAARRRLVARRRQALGRPRRRRPADRRDGRQQVIVDRAIPLTPPRGRARLVRGADAGVERCRSRSARRTSHGRGRA